MKRLVAPSGFTLIELIVVIGIIAILAAIVIVAVNPARQFASARNTARSNDTLAIVDAIYQQAADSSTGVFNAALTGTNFTTPPSGSTTTYRNVCTTVSTTGGTASVVNSCRDSATGPSGSTPVLLTTNNAPGVALGTGVLVPNYLSGLPNDPSKPGVTVMSAEDTGYDLGVTKDSTGAVTKITVYAPLTELSKPTINATR